MANPLPNSIERLRYFDGEYLRSYDFTDEQSYHVAMRRLMNLKLHLHGIVEGLEIEKDATSTAGATFYSILPGMAIDQAGREIVVPAPYSLSNVLTQPNLYAGMWYEVWICYQETETSLPAAGYLDCNATNQYTRWQEGFQVQLVPTSGPNVLPNCGGVRLGLVQLVPDPSGKGLAIQTQTSLTTYNTKRHYVGIRAQEIKAPDQVDTDPFDMTVTTSATDPLTVPDPFPPSGYLQIKPSSVEHGNLFVEKNVAIGTDFSIDTTDNSITPPADGNLIVSHDLFVGGNLYLFNPDAPSGSQWYSLQQLIPSSFPSIVMGTFSITPDNLPNATGSSSQTVTAPYPTTNGSIAVALSGIVWTDPSNFHKYWGTSATPVTIQVAVPGGGFASSSPTGSTAWDLTINWTVGPTEDTGSSVYIYPASTIYVTYVAVFLPPS